MNLNALLKNSIKNRVTLLALLIFLIGVWSLAFFALHMARINSQQVTAQQQVSTAALLADEIGDEIKFRTRALEAIAAEISPTLLGDPKALQAHLEQRQLLALLFNGGYSVTQADATVIASVPLSGGRVGLNYMDREYVAGALKQGVPRISQPHASKKLKTPEFSIVVPIRDAQARVTGVVFGTIDLAQPNFLDHLAGTGYGASGGYLLVARQSRMIVTASQRKHVLELLPAPGVSPQIDRYIDGAEGASIFIDPLGKEILAAVKQVATTDWYVAVYLPTTEAFSHIDRAYERMLMSATVLSVLMGGLIWLLLRHQLAPLQGTARALTAMTDSWQLSQALPVTKSDEVGLLIESFNRMLAELKQREAALKETEASLRASEQRSRMAQEGAHVGVWAWDLETGKCWWSDECVRLYGFEPGTLEDTAQWRSHVEPEDLVGIDAQWDSRIARGEPFEVEFRFRQPSGEIRWLLSKGRAQYDGQRKPVSLYGINVDITENKQNETLVRTKSEQLRLLYDAGQRLNRTLDLHEIYLAVNEFTSVIAPESNFSISAFDPATQLISCRAYVMDGKALDVNTFPSIPLEDEGKGTQSLVIRSGKALLLNDYQTRVKTAQTSYLVHDQTHEVVAQVEDEEDVVQSALIVPLKVGNTVTGVVQVMSYHRNAFDQDQLQMLEALALHIASAEQNARLYSQLQAELKERVAAQEAQRIAAIAFESQQGMYITDAKKTILRVNKMFSEITGYSAQEAIGQTPRLLSSGQHDGAFYTAMWDSINRSGAWQGEIRNRRKNGTIYPQSLSISSVRNDVGLTTHFVGAFTDVSSYKAAEEQIQNLAFTDQVTGLPNRTLLTVRMDQAMAPDEQRRHQNAALLVDLDNFKNINDTLGHENGDLVLQSAAKRLRDCVREGDTVARLGADEFVLLLTHLNPDPLEAIKQTQTVAGKILEALRQPYRIEQVEVSCSASIGISLFGLAHENVAEPLKRAELAMYQAKAAGRNTLRFFEPQMQALVSARLALEAALREAIQKQQFELYYQPQLNDQGHITGVEALLRWQHPLRGLVPPAEFIALAEETGLILPIGNWVLETACKQLASWAGQSAFAELTIAVNVSARQFHQADFVEQVLAHLQSTGADPHRLELELTETMLVAQVEEVIAKMKALQARGIRFSLDDFGTGYSSLAYLKRLPLDQLKIDQGFVRDILTDADDAAISKMVIALADSMGLRVIAEGVETEAQRELLARLGCLNYQGYLFSRPLPLAQFEAYARRL